MSATLRSARETDPDNLAANYLNASSFTAPDYVVVSAWLEHAPFAFWLVSQVRPTSLVELGTHNGFSYFSFCQAITALDSDGRTFAVDTWAGDGHTGEYGSDVYLSVLDVNEANYSSFSSLLRMTFDNALHRIPGGSVDLLHIDGFHTYEAVKHDFETWLPKLSDRGIVLMHDIREYKDDFGIHKFWDELTERYPTFDFVHGHGLGVVGVGSDVAPSVAALFAEGERTQHAVRAAYARLGRAVSGGFYANEEQRLRRAVEVERRRSQRDVATYKTQNATMQAALVDSRSRIAILAARNEKLRSQVKVLNKRITQIKESTSWRVTKPLRAVRRSPSPKLAQEGSESG